MTYGGSTPPPGWYPDPWYPASTRYWDGTGWTEHAAAAPGAMAMAPAGPVLDVAGGREWADHAGKAFLAQGFVLAVSALLYPLAFGSLFHDIRDSIDNASSNSTTTTSPAFGVAVVPLNLLSLVSIAAIIVLCIWTGKATTNARALGRPTTHTPGMAIAGWFIPIVNLWFPYQAVRDLFPADHPARSTVKAWWAFYLSASFLLLVPMVGLLFLSTGLATLLALAPAAMAVAAGTLGRRAALAAGDDHAHAAQALYAGTA